MFKVRFNLLNYLCPTISICRNVDEDHLEFLSSNKRVLSKNRYHTLKFKCYCTLCMQSKEAVENFNWWVRNLLERAGDNPILVYLVSKYVRFLIKFSQKWWGWEPIFEIWWFWPNPSNPCQRRPSRVSGRCKNSIVINE